MVEPNKVFVIRNESDSLSSEKKAEDRTRYSEMEERNQPFQRCQDEDTTVSDINNDFSDVTKDNVVSTVTSRPELDNESNKNDVELGYREHNRTPSTPMNNDSGSISSFQPSLSSSSASSSSTDYLLTKSSPPTYEKIEENDDDPTTTTSPSRNTHTIQRRRRASTTTSTSVLNVDHSNRQYRPIIFGSSSSSQPFLKRIKRGPRLQTNSYHEQSTLALWLSSFQYYLLKIYQYLLEKCSILLFRLSSSSPSSSMFFVDPTISIPLLVFIDMFAVSFVVPLLYQYYQRAGINDANQREFLSSIFSCSQIIGGIVMSFSTDAYHIQRRTLLLFSFIGSAISYALIIHGGLYPLIVSRILVGLVKQTMTVTTTMMTQLTTTSNRAKYMGRITAASTVAWIIGPSIGSLLYKNIDYRAPAYVACIMFLLNVVLVILWIHDDHHITSFALQSRIRTPHNHPSRSVHSTKSNSTIDNEIFIEDSHDVNNFIANGEQQLHHNTTIDSKATVLNQSSSKTKTRKGLRSMLSNLRICFSSKLLGSIVITKLLLTWVGQATNYSSLGSFYEEMYSLQPYHRGYISSYQQLLQFLVQSFLVESILQKMGGERKVTCYFATFATVAIILEIQRSLWFFLIVLTPCISLCFSMIQLSVQTLITHVAPTETIFSVLAALDVLQNIAHVTVPFYRTILFRYLQKPQSVEDTLSLPSIPKRMIGDPDPIKWIISSSFHWMIVSIIVSYLLLYNNSKEWELAEQHSNHFHIDNQEKTTTRDQSNVESSMGNNNNVEVAKPAASDQTKKST